MKLSANSVPKAQNVAGRGREAIRTPPALSLGTSQEIEEFIPRDSFDAADRVLDDLDLAFNSLAATPGMGHRRDDITRHDVLFWPVHSYLVIYRNSTPLQIVRVIHVKRDVKKLLAR